MTAPTHPEPRPDDEGRERWLRDLAREMGRRAGEVPLGDSFRGGSLHDASVYGAWQFAIARVKESAIALTPHPAPLGATDEGLREGWEAVCAEHERATAAMTSAHATDRLREAAEPTARITWMGDSFGRFTEDGGIESTGVARPEKPAGGVDPLRSAVVAFLASWDAMAPFTTRDAPMIGTLRAALQAGG